jgi:hypothetical protein
MKIGTFQISFTFARSGQISAVITEGGLLIDAVTGFDLGKVTAAAVRAANFYGVEK